MCNMNIIYQRYSGLFSVYRKTGNFDKFGDKSEIEIAKVLVQLINLPKCQAISMKMSSIPPKFISSMLFLVEVSAFTVKIF